jgi:hypothetical protein
VPPAFAAWRCRGLPGRGACMRGQGAVGAHTATRRHPGRLPGVVVALVDDDVGVVRAATHRRPKRSHDAPTQAAGGRVLVPAQRSWPG